MAGVARVAVRPPKRSSRLMPCPIHRQGTRRGSLRTTDVSLESGDTERCSAPVRYALRSFPGFRQPCAGPDRDRRDATHPDMPCGSSIRDVS